MANDNQFVDPLQEMMERYEHTVNPDEAKTEDTSPLATADLPEEEDEYGVGDQQREMAEEEAIMEAARAARQEELAAAVEANKTEVVMPPRSLDPEFQKESMEFQGSTLEIVGRMIDKVVAKNNITSGGIPESTDSDPNFKMHLMGELISLYHINGEEITPEFEDIIISNWRTESGAPITTDEELVEEQTEEEIVERQEPVEVVPEININVEAGQDVTVNIDEDIVNEMSETKKVNIRVIETTVEQMRSATIIENSQCEGIITPYKSDMYNTPIALPLSGYRCVITPLSYFEYIQLTSTPSSGNRVDQDKRVWSILYKHITNVSIGEFKNFEDFLKKTKYADQQLLLWGVLISSAEDEETATIVCGNPKCRQPHEIKYRPRSIIHINDELAERCDYKTTGTVAPGPAAIEHYNKINSTVKMYELPNTKWLVEIDARSSAYEFLNVKYPLMEQLRKRFTKDEGDEDSPDNNDEHEFLLAHALFIKAVSKKVNGKTYRYTTWEDIEKVITESLDVHDSAVLMNLIRTVGMQNFDPIQFYIENITCDKCGRHEDRIDIPDIGQSLIFQLSQRLSSTEISLTEMEQN